jgi:hypothetical protein
MFSEVRNTLHDSLQKQPYYAPRNTDNGAAGIPGFYWGVWALIQATISQIDFDYASYAELRLGEYWAWKAESDGSRKQNGGELPLRERRWAEE